MTKNQNLSDLPSTLPRVLVRWNFLEFNLKTFIHDTYNTILCHNTTNMAVLINWVVASKEKITKSVYTVHKYVNLIGIRLIY